MGEPVALWNGVKVHVGLSSQVLRSVQLRVTY